MKLEAANLYTFNSSFTILENFMPHFSIIHVKFNLYIIQQEISSLSKIKQTILTSVLIPSSIWRKTNETILEEISSPLKF